MTKNLSKNHKFDKDKFSNSIFSARLNSNFSSFFEYLGNLETDMLSSKLKNIEIKNPVLITGLARGGTTILLNSLYKTNQFATTRYSDFPYIFTPIWRRFFIDKFARDSKNNKFERAHGDGINVSISSPESMEETIWNHFFNSFKKDSFKFDPNSSKCKEFENFYKSFIKKLLYNESKQRFLIKNNYNISRLEYLVNLFADIKIIIPVRHPEHHIKSLINQHKRFMAITEQSPKSYEYMNHSGHYEFGPNIKPINLSLDSSNCTNNDFMNKNDDELVTSFSKYWSSIYSYVYKIKQESGVAKNLKIIKYEDLCSLPEENFRKICDFCEIEITDSQLNNIASDFKIKNQEDNFFTKDQKEIISQNLELYNKF